MVKKKLLMKKKLKLVKDPNAPADTAKRKLANANLSNPVEETKCYIYRVHDHLRNLNPRAYEPHILAIGPYHHGKANTRPMEKHKFIYLNALHQRKSRSVDTFRATINKIGEEINQKAPSCYDDSIVSTEPHEFTQMMLLDGCFIIELLLREADEDGNSRKSDPIFETEWMLSSMQRDLMLFENQIPFFVLRKLFNLVEGSNYQRLLDLIFNFFKSSIPGSGYKLPPNTHTTMTNADDIKHLLHLIHIFWSPDSLGTSQITVAEKPWRFVRSATKLRDSHVKFEINGQGTSLFKVTFENGTLKLSPLQIEDGTEDLFRNLIAYEQFFPKSSHVNFVTDYVAFLDSLIDSPRDVEILRGHGILENWLGSDEVVSDIFNKLSDSVTIRYNFIYGGVCDDMKRYCKRRRNIFKKWMVMLWRNHLSSPWTIISLVVAGVLLFLTAVQTWYSVFKS